MIIDFSSSSDFHTHQVVGLVLVHLSDGLVMLCSHRETSHVSVDVDGFQQTSDSLIGIHLETTKAIKICDKAQGGLVTFLKQFAAST